MKNVEEIAAIWDTSPRAVRELCNKGRIPGAMKKGRKWFLPDDAVKPEDGRVTSGKYLKKDNHKKTLPIGISDYIRAQKEYYYVDKTLLIKEFLDRKPLVSLFTRPRRFGKTLNMDMLRVFFEKTSEDTSKYFIDKAIWKCGKTYREHQGRYPIIFLTFKDVKFNSWEATRDKISSLIQDEYRRHSEVLTGDILSETEKKFFAKILNGNGTEVELSSSLEKLSEMLNSYYKIAPIIIIDEYDTPIQEGYSKDFYNDIIGFMRNFFSGAFKDNKNLSYGFLTGILRIAQESIFSGLNNLTVNSVMDDEYAQCFGFTDDEIKAMLKYYDVQKKEDELKAWYDGYVFGGTEIYNPWSVINYVSKGCNPQAYWANTGRNEIIEEVLSVTSDDINEKLHVLLEGKTITVSINQNVVYKTLTSQSSYIFSLLLVAGYLKAVKKEIRADGTYICEVAIPNKEIEAVYRSEILAKLAKDGIIGETTAGVVAESLYSNNIPKLRAAIKGYLEKTVSFYDGVSENFYHGLTLGLISLMDDKYVIKSNRESGNGRFDIGLFPKNLIHPGIIIECKWEAKTTDAGLATLAQTALSQIDEKGYDQEFKQKGIEKIIHLGISFSGKKVEVLTE